MRRQSGAQRSAKPGPGAKAGKTRRRALIYGAGASILAGLAGWGFWSTSRGRAETVTTDAIGDQGQPMSKGQLPEFARTGESGRPYRYAAEHGDELQYIPCFCGCYRFGHKSNRDCYIKAFHRDGTLNFTSHAAT